MPSWGRGQVLLSSLQHWGLGQRKGHPKGVTWRHATRHVALGHRASKVCHVIFADVIGWPGAAKHLEHQWTCHRVPLCTGPMRPKIHRYPRHSWLMWRTCSQELAHHILSPWVLAREPWTQLCSDQHQPLSKKLKTERNYVVVFDYCHRFSGVGQSWWSM